MSGRAAPRHDEIQEEWRAIAGYPGYEVSDLGRVRRTALYDSHGREVYEALLVSPSPGRRSSRAKQHFTLYLEVSLRVGENQRKLKKIHHLVAEAFHGTRPPGLMALHGNGDPLDNRATNLRWGTQSENMMDFHQHRGPKKECKHGHDLTNSENSYVYGSQRKCKPCASRRASEQREDIRGGVRPPVNHSRSVAERQRDYRARAKARNATG